MDTTGAAFAVGLALTLICSLGALFSFAWAMATLEVYGASRARPAFIALGICLVGIVVGAGLVGAAA